MGAALKPRLSLQDYLAWEEQQPDKNELVRGEIVSMVGARRVHGQVVMNIARELGNQLRGSPCRVFQETMKLQVADDVILYPDLFVTCDKADLATELLFKSPTLIIEVLSPSTQARDRSVKFAWYRRIAALQEYILVDPDSCRVEAFRRGAEDLWSLYDMSDGDAMDAASVGCRVLLRDIFDGVTPAEEPGEDPGREAGA
jgi:Uma2 family endonuclease